MESKDLIGKMVGILFMSRDYAHRAHLATPSFAKHKALNELYDGVVDLADDLAEAAQGKFGILDIAVIPLKGDIEDPIAAIESHVTMIDNLAKKCEVDYLSNIIQEIQKLYYSTLYKLKALD